MFVLQGTLPKGKSPNSTYSLVVTPSLRRPYTQWYFIISDYACISYVWLTDESKRDVKCYFHNWKQEIWTSSICFSDFLQFQPPPCHWELYTKKFLVVKTNHITSIWNDTWKWNHAEHILQQTNFQQTSSVMALKLIINKFHPRRLYFSVLWFVLWMDCILS